MLNIVIIAAALALLGGLLYFEKNQKPSAILPVKAPLSALFVIAACLQPHPNMNYTGALLVGLIFCLGGDLLLVSSQRRLFLLGLISFLLGHIAYIVAIVGVSNVNYWTAIGVVVTLVASTWIFIRFAPHLGSMKPAVLAYIIVITLMLCAAWSIFGTRAVPQTGRYMVFFGALFFYLSDIFVARQRFIKPDFTNRLVGLPLYYLGQFLLAFSTGIIPNTA